MTGITLDATTRSLEVKLTGAITTNQLDWDCDYIDYLDSDQSCSDIAHADGTSNSTTAVTVVAAPSAGHTRHIKRFTIHNNDTVAAEVTLRYNNNGTFRTIWRVTLQTLENAIDE